MWVLAELITRRSGMDYRDFVRRRILEPLGLADLHLGLPPAEHARVAEVIAVGRARSKTKRGMSPVDAPAVDEADLARMNGPAWRELGIPAGGAFATAAAIALFYQGLLADAAGRGAGIWKPSQLQDAWTPRHVELLDPMTRQKALRGLGVVVAGERGRMWRGFAESCSARSFGHMGLGGQIAWADPESGLSFAFCTNGAQRNPARQGAAGFQLSTLAAACAG
jgi:CubicO group peptidase (beta-lactamase class C family)